MLLIDWKPQFVVWSICCSPGRLNSGLISDANERLATTPSHLWDRIEFGELLERFDAVLRKRRYLSSRDPSNVAEMIIRSPYVMQGYWNNPEETAGQLKDGWLYTGDIATADEDGYLFIVDRKKDMIIAGGYNIYPREIDEVLFQHPKVAEAVSLGVPDQYRGETVKAFVVLKDGETADEEEIIAFCRERLAAYKAPKTIEFRQELPKSAVGKLLRKVLRDEELAKLKDKA